MSTSVDFVGFIIDQIHGVVETRYRKMFGEYMVYVNDKPILLVCDDTVYIKRLAEVAELMKNAETGFPYQGAKEHYILDIDNAELAKEVIEILEPITPLPKKRARKS
jgi:TfoX/Sxy family transcriptional regulator of competence genes